MKKKQEIDWNKWHVITIKDYFTNLNEIDNQLINQKHPFRQEALKTTPTVICHIREFMLVVIHGSIDFPFIRRVIFTFSVIKKTMGHQRKCSDAIYNNPVNFKAQTQLLATPQRPKSAIIQIWFMSSDDTLSHRRPRSWDKGASSHRASRGTINYQHLSVIVKQTKRWYIYIGWPRCI